MIKRFIKRFNREDGLFENVIWLTIIMALFFGIMQFGFWCRAQNVCTTAAREGARAMAIYHDTSTAKQKIVDTITGQLYIGTSLGGGSDPIHSTFDAYNPNSTTPDVVINDDGTYSSITVYYHIPTIVPGVPKMLDSSAPFWSTYITTSGYASFKDEVS